MSYGYDADVTVDPDMMISSALAQANLYVPLICAKL
jgi:hypothetical protein